MPHGSEQHRTLPENKSSSIIHFHCTPQRFIYGGKLGMPTAARRRKIYNEHTIWVSDHQREVEDHAGKTIS